MEGTFDYLMNDCHNFHQKTEFQPEYIVAETSNELPESKASVMPKKELINPISHDYIIVKSVGKIEFIDHNDVIWLYASANYIEIFLEGRSILHRDSLINLENKFKKTHFVRVHRSSIVNLNKIKSIESDKGRYNSITLTSGHNVKLSSTYRADLFEHLGVEHA
jgi:two-component system LytT family response regulator